MKIFGKSLLAAGALALLLAASPATSRAQDKKLLFLTHAGLYKHTSLGPAEKAVTEWGESAEFEVTTLEGYKQESDSLDLSIISADYLAQFDAVMFFTNGNLPFTDSQNRAIIDFVKSGKGFIGIHCASLTLYTFPEYGEMLGGYFQRPVRQNRIFVLKVEDPNHPATKMLGSSWPLVDEFYLYGNEAWDASRPDENLDALFDNRIPMGFSRDRVRVLLSIDTEQSNLDGLERLGIVRGGDYPQAWCRDFGQGRSFYTSIGHRDDIWTSDPVFAAHLTGGIRWALGLEPGDATPMGPR